MSLRIKWSGKKFSVTLTPSNYYDSNQQIFNQVCLLNLIEECSRITGVKPENIKLLHSGGKLKSTTKKSIKKEKRQEEPANWFSELSDKFLAYINNDNDEPKQSSSWVVLTNPTASLASYGIKDNSVIMMIGNNNQLPIPPPKQSSAPIQIPPAQKALSALAQINQNLESSQRIDIEKLSQNINRFADGEKFGVDSKVLSYKSLEKDWIVLNEGLMQCLLKTDNYVLDSEQDPEEKVRIKRKETVKLIQSYLSRVDTLKERLESQAVNKL